MAWIAEHHFSNKYGIMPDPFTYIGYLAPQTTNIKLGTAVMTLPFSNPVRVAENTGFVDILTGGRFILGIGSGYRPYECEGFGVDFDARRDIQEESVKVMLDLFHTGQVNLQGTYGSYKVEGDYQLYPVPVQRPHPPIYMAAGTERSMGFAGTHGFGMMLSTLPAFDTLAEQIKFYRQQCEQAPAPLNENPACGQVDIARWVYVAETGEQAKNTAGYLGSVSEKGADAELNYDELVETTIIHGSPETVIRRINELKDATGLDSLLLHYPPYYCTEKVKKMLKLFAEQVMPAFR
ncbi:MAG: hypothetical protein DRQ52_04090 [Gammaproteobacteria bacterium]|nr:MAG: hypothetical protein DRQ52_04090 [Gammaproteobacteria bacterium]